MEALVGVPRLLMLVRAGVAKLLTILLLLLARGNTLLRSYLGVRKLGLILGH